MEKIAENIDKAEPVNTDVNVVADVGSLIGVEVDNDAEKGQTPNDLVDVIVGIPVNTALMKISVLTVREDGTPEEKTGEFNFEQILASRTRAMQLFEIAAKNGGLSSGNELGEHAEDGEPAGSKATEEEPESCSKSSGQSDK